MAKVSPVSIKYMIHANLNAEGALEKPDVIGALFGQTEGLLGPDLEMRELQKEGKIGRIEVDLERQEKRTLGTIKIPTALDQSETALIAAALETIERVGPCDAQIEIEKIEDVRGNKRDYILERAKKLMTGIEGSTDSRDISNQIKDSTKIAGVKEYGKNKLACGTDFENKELIVVEGRADVVNLVRAGINNVIGMNGTKLPDEIKELAKTKDIILFIDGDRGGKLIAQNVMENADVKYIAVAPDGKEVEELTSKEILMNLRKKVPARDFFSSFERNFKFADKTSLVKNTEKEKIELSAEDKEKLKKISRSLDGSGKAVFLDKNLKELKSVSQKSISSSLRRIMGTAIIVIDGSATPAIINSSEESGVQAVVAKNFQTTDTKIKLMSL
ncbi:DNA primase [Candidatus Pacearchaeota archaeon]|nr:DNA primase [Candidatus Pacearchaeota archaeon]